MRKNRPVRLVQQLNIRGQRRSHQLVYLVQVLFQKILYAAEIHIYNIFTSSSTVLGNDISSIVAASIILVST